MPKENSTANLMMIAEQVKAAGNFEEAFNYYSKVLEIDPNNYKAWFGKGECAGSLSTIKTFRLDEMLKYMELSVDLAPVNQKQNLKDEAADIITNISSAYFRLVRSHFYEFKELKESKAEYTERCLNVVKALDRVHVLFAPGYKYPLEIIISICKYMQEENLYPSSGDSLARRIANYTLKLEELKTPEDRREELRKKQEDEEIKQNNDKAISKTILIVVIIIVGFMVTIKMINQMQNNALSEKEARAKILEEEEKKEQKIQEEQEENLKKQQREKVKNKLIGEGDSSKVILEMFGKPSKVEKKVVVATGKQQETWSYYPKPKNSFQLIIFLEDDKVIKWEDKRQK